MWGRAQRDATRRCASDWGHNLGKGRVKIPLVATSRVPNISLHSTRSVDRRWVREGSGGEGRGEDLALKKRKKETSAVKHKSTGNYRSGWPNKGGKS